MTQSIDVGNRAFMICYTLSVYEIEAKASITLIMLKRKIPKDILMLWAHIHKIHM